MEPSTVFLLIGFRTHEIELNTEQKNWDPIHYTTQGANYPQLAGNIVFREPFSCSFQAQLQAGSETTH